MQARRYLSILGCIAVLSTTAPRTHAAPAAQWPAPATASAPEAGILWALQQVVPPEVLRQAAVQFQPLDWNTYLISHPRLFWPVAQAPNAQAVAQQLANQGPGWNVHTSEGPQGYGVYLTYDTVPTGSSQTSLLSAAQQHLPLEALQQTPFQFQPLDGDTYLLSHPYLFWPVSEAAAAQAVAQQYASRLPGVHTTVFNGPQGYGLYLTYDTVSYGTPQAGLLPAVQQILPPEALQQSPLQLQPLDGSTYLVSHPSLFWPMAQAPNAQAVVQQLASQGPGWNVTTADGPLGNGVYLIYQPGAADPSRAGFLSAVQQVIPPDRLRQSPLQLQPLYGSTYLVSHPTLFWPASEAPAARSVVQQLLTRTPGWGMTVHNGAQGYGIYLTYQPTA